MFGFKIKIMVISIGREANFFYLRNLAFSLHFFFFLLLFVKKFIIVNYFTNWRIGLRRNFNKVKSLVICYSLRFRNGVNSYFNIIANQTYLRYLYHMVGSVFLLLLFFETWIKCTSWCSWWKCH